MCQRIPHRPRGERRAVGPSLYGQPPRLQAQSHDPGGQRDARPRRPQFGGPPQTADPGESSDAPRPPGNRRPPSLAPSAPHQAAGPKSAHIPKASPNSARPAKSVIVIKVKAWSRQRANSPLRVRRHGLWYPVGPPQRDTNAVPPTTSSATTSSIGSPRSPTQASMSSGKASVPASASSAEPSKVVAHWSTDVVLLLLCPPHAPQGRRLRTDARLTRCRRPRLGFTRSVTWRKRHVRPRTDSDWGRNQEAGTAHAARPVDHGHRVRVRP